MKHKVLITITLILASLVMQAQNIIRPKVECPNGIYVNSYNGVLFYQRPDVSVSNRNMRLEAVFYYNSSSNKNNYGYGNGWSLGGELRYIEDSLGVIIEQGDGRRDMFTRYGNSFEAPAGVFSTLSIEGNGYLLTYKDGTKYYFADAQSKKVTLVKDRYDNTITYAYQDGNLATATDISGRSLNFTWADSLLVGLSTSFDDRTWSYQYDEKGNLTCVTDPMGYSVYYAYDKDNRIKTFTDAEGYSTHVSYNVDGMAHRVKTDLTDKSIRYELAKRQTVFIDYFTDANNQYSKYMWDEAGRLVEIVNVNMGTSTKFAYDDDNNLIRRVDANGHAYTYTYDQNGNRLSATDPLGNTEYYTYESTYNNVTSYTDRMGHYYNYQYDSHGDLLQMNGPLNYSLSMTYNQYGQPVTVTDANGNTSHYGYDGYGNLISMTDPLGNVTTLTYNLAGMPMSQTLPNGAVSTFVYDNADYLVEAIDGLNFSTKMQYDRKGNMVSYTDALNNTFTLSYDAIGQQVSSLSPDGALTRFYYSGSRLSKIVDALNHEIRYEYDDNNWLTMTVDVANDTIRNVYDNVGNLVGMTMPYGENIVCQYDELNRVITATDQLGTFFVNHYDANGNIVQQENAMGYSDYYVYDALNRLIQHTDAMGNSEYLSYDNNGNVLTYLDKNGNSTVMTYDANGYLLTHTDALNYVTSYSYDGNGNLISMTDANNNMTTYQYDQLQQLKKIIFPNGKMRRFWYDGNGNVTLLENEAGEQTAVIYDALDRVTATNCIGNADEYSSFQFDLVGNLIEAVNKNAVSSFVYDEFERLSSESTNGYTTSYAYNSVKNTINVTYPNGRTLEEKYDIRSRLVTIKENGNVTASFGYNNADAIITRSYVNGTVTDCSYDALGRILEISDNQSIVDYQFVYDVVGNLLARKDMVNQERSQTYAYDALNRMVEFQEGIISDYNHITNPIQNKIYGYDSMDNRTTLVSNDGIVEYAVNSMNAYTSINTNGSSQTMTYDDKGNLVFDGIHSYQHDSQNRLVSVDGGNTTFYKYDAMGRLIQSQHIVEGNNLIKNYCYAGDRMVEERNAFGDVLKSSVYGVNSRDILQCTIGRADYFYLKDQNGSTAAMIDVLNVAQEIYDFDPYGLFKMFDFSGNEVSYSILGNSYGYYGLHMDEQLGTFQMTENNYNPEVGRYIEPEKMVNFRKNSYVETDSQYTLDNSIKSFFNDLNVIDIISYETDIFDKAIGYIIDNIPQDSYINKDGFASLIKHKKPITHVNQGQNQFTTHKVTSVLSKYQKIANTAGEVLTVAGTLVSGINLAKKVKGTNRFEDSWQAHGGYLGGNLFGFIGGGIGGVPGAIVGSIAGDWIGSNIASEGGRRLDAIYDVLEYDCIQFMANGYENSNAEQQWLYRKFHDAPTNEYYKMFGMRHIFSDKNAEKIYNFNNKFANTKFGTWLREKVF